MINKIIAVWIGIAITVASIIFTGGKLCKAIEDCEQDVQSIAQTQQMMIDKIYTAQIEQTEKMYELFKEFKDNQD